MAQQTGEPCPICGVVGSQQTVIGKFRTSDHGHRRCRACGATFDSNALEMRAVHIDADTIENVGSRDDYRKLFVETWKIGTEEGEVYPRFEWEDNAALREGVAGHIVSAVRRHAPAGDLDVLDIGCGNGFTTEILAREFGRERIIGLDPSPMINELEARTGVKGIRGTLDTVAFDAEQFDVVVVVGNLMLHRDMAATMDEVHRILKPGGIAVIDFKNINSAPRLVSSLLARRVPRLQTNGFIERNFVNMRYGIGRRHLPLVARPELFAVLEVTDKPPRLLEFANRSHWQSGLAGTAWRVLHAIDRKRGEQAWIQAVVRKV